MSLLSRAVDLITFRDLPANQPVRTLATNTFDRRSLGDAIPGWSSGKPTWPTDNVLVLTRDGYRKCVTAFACINVISDAVSEATLRVWLDQGSGKRDEEVDHPLRALMQRPHPSRSESEFLAITVRIAAITGYCVIEKVRARAGNVIQLGHLRPDYLKPILRDQQPPNWEYTIPGSPPVILDADDAVVYTYMDSPFLDVTGDTPMRAVLREAGILNDLTDFVKLTLERGGMPSILLVEETNPDPQVAPPDPLTDDERAVIREAFVQKYGGYRNWSGPAIIGGFRVERLSFNLNEMAFADLRDGVDVAVCRAFRVPPPVVQVMAGLTTSYGQTLEQSMALLQLYTANPLRARLDGALTRSLLPEFDSRPNVSLEFDTSQVDALQEDEDKVHARARENFRAGGVTLDEFRQRIGEEPLDNDLGHSLLLSFSVVPMPVDAEPEPDKPAPVDKPPADEEEERFVTRDGRRYINDRALSPLALEQRAVAGSMARLHIARLADLVAPKVETFFQGQKERVLDEVLGAARSLDDLLAESVPAARLTALPERRRALAVTMSKRAIEQLDWATEDDLLDRLMRAWWASVGETAFEAASGQLGVEIDWSLSNQYLRQIADLLGYRITDINETTRQQIEALITEALLAGTTIHELGDKITGLFDQTYASRHLTIARTESMIAYGQASTVAFQASGVVSQVQVADNRSHTESYPNAADGLTCAQRDGLVVALDRGMFHVRSDHPNGSACLLPVLTTPLGEVE